VLKCESGETQQGKQEYWKSVSATQQGNAHMSCKHREVQDERVYTITRNRVRKGNFHVQDSDWERLGNQEVEWMSAEPQEVDVVKKDICYVSFQFQSEPSLYCSLMLFASYVQVPLLHHIHTQST